MPPKSLLKNIFFLVNKTIQPRPVNATSIPNMIQIFQNEWDSVMLEVYTLKQHLEAVRQELSHALYQHDAACRVIARLIKERDESRQQLSSLMETVKNSSEIEIENGDKSFILPEPIIKQIQDTHDSLFSMRKERKKKENVWADYSTLEVNIYKIIIKIGHYLNYKKKKKLN
jgi:pre-mRNA-processing factor 19